MRNLCFRGFLDKNNIKRIVLTKEEFVKNNMRCPYLVDDRCVIYPVRPIVCRLQGNISELKCKSSEPDMLMSSSKLEDIRKEFVKLTKLSNGVNVFYSTLRLDNKS